MIYTFLLNPTVVVRVRSDDLFPPQVAVQRIITEYLRSLHTENLAVIEATCNRAWPHGSDNEPLVPVVNMGNYSQE